MAESKIQNNIFEEIGPIITLNSTGSTYFEITDQKVYRLGNVVYIYLIMHKIQQFSLSYELSIGTCSIKPKGNTIIPQFSGLNSLIIQYNGNILFVDTTDTRNWYNWSGNFIAQ